MTEKDRIIGEKLLKIADITGELHIINTFFNNAILIVLGKLDKERRFDMTVKIDVDLDKYSKDTIDMLSAYDIIKDSYLSSIYILYNFNKLIKEVKILDKEEYYIEELTELVDAVLEVTKKLQKFNENVIKEGII